MNVNITRYEKTFVPELTALLRRDRYAFAVMGNILGGDFGPVSTIVTDHARFILCYTCPPFPGWVWIPRDASEEEMARAWALIQEELPLEAKGRVNMRPELAQYILSTPGNTLLHMELQIDAYACDTLLPLERQAPGDSFAAGMDWLDTATEWLYAMKQETGLDPMPREACAEEMRGFIANRRLFVWKADGQIVSMCAVTVSGETGYIGHVYTPKAYRRKGYAQSLVCRVTCVILVQDMNPALCVVSTNEAAAACYRKLGFELKGSFCTVGK